MDWRDVLASLVGSAALIAFLAQVLKKWLDRSIDSRFERLREFESAEVRELFRQQTALRDEQISQLQSLLELLGTMRDQAVRALEHAQRGWSMDMNQALRAIADGNKSLQELVHKGRTVLPIEAFVVVHELGREVDHLRRLASPRGDELPEDVAYTETFLDELRGHAERIESGFQYLTGLARIARGTDPPGSPTKLSNQVRRAVMPDLGKLGAQNREGLEEFMRGSRPGVRPPPTGRKERS